jgi:hypothetical protein
VTAVGEAASEFFSERDTVMFRSDTFWAAELCMERNLVVLRNRFLHTKDGLVQRVTSALEVVCRNRNQFQV